MPEAGIGSVVLFYFLAGVILSCCGGALLARNFVHSTVFLAGALLGFAGLYALLGATFLALMQVFVYAGAVTILIVFVIMMTHTSVPTWGELLQRQRVFALAVVGVFAWSVFGAVFALVPRLSGPIRDLGGTTALAHQLFSTYAAPFELASGVLLAALVGAMYLAREAE